MFRVIPTTEAAKNAIGLRWTVEQENFDGTTQPFAYFEHEADALQVAEVLNENASVVACAAEVAAEEWSLDCCGPVS